MLTRRNVLQAAGAVAASTLIGRSEKAAAQSAAPRFDVPRLACDCHVHIVGPQSHYPMVANRTYTAPEATVDQLLALQKHLGLQRVVVVQPSFYGTDNRCTIDAVRRLGKRARGVAVIDDTVTDAALDAMARAGIRGVRLNLETAGQSDPAAAAAVFRNTARRVASRNWHLQAYTRVSVISALKDEIAGLPVPVVIDHFGAAQAEAGADQAGFDALLGLVRSGKVYVKISGAYRISKRGPDYVDAMPMARALVSANPDRIVWGTDWPHTNSARVPERTAFDPAPFQKIDDAVLLGQLAAWVPDAATRHKILVENPARLYQF